MFRIIFLFIFCSCSGYRFSQQENPLKQYGIRSLSVPMFYNYSNISEAPIHFTREIYRLLSRYSGLKLKSGYDNNTDAVLIGILKSPEKLTESVRPTNLRLAQERAQNAIGTKRENFYVPGSSDVQLFLHIILIKKPTQEELALLKSNIGLSIKTNSKVLFNELIPLRTQYTREILDDEGVEVVGTQNDGVQRKAVRSLAEQAATTIQDMILYAF